MTDPSKTLGQVAYDAAREHMVHPELPPWGELDDWEHVHWETIAAAVRTAAQPELARIKTIAVTGWCNAVTSTQLLNTIVENDDCVCEGGFMDRFCAVCEIRGALEKANQPLQRGDMRAARAFLDAATAWADLREKNEPDDKLEQEAWDRLYALYEGRRHE